MCSIIFIMISDYIYLFLQSLPTIQKQIKLYILFPVFVASCGKHLLYVYKTSQLNVSKHQPLSGNTKYDASSIQEMSDYFLFSFVRVDQIVRSSYYHLLESNIFLNGKIQFHFKIFVYKLPTSSWMKMRITLNISFSAIN